MSYAVAEEETGNEYVTITIKYFYENKELNETVTDTKPKGEVYDEYQAKCDNHQEGYSNLRAVETVTVKLLKATGVYSQDSPIIEGYTADQLSVSYTLDADHTYYVYYSPANINYTLNIYRQNLDNDDYTLVQTISGSGLTGTTPSELKNIDNYVSNMNGFSFVNSTPDAITPDNTTFECYYNRDYHTVYIDLDGGYGVDSIYAKYGTIISLGIPEKTGYVFNGWEAYKVDDDGNTQEDTLDSVPVTVPTYDVKFKATWKAQGNVTYRVVYQNADLNPTGGATTYSFWGSDTATTTAGTKLTLTQILKDYQNNPTTNKLSDNAYFTFDLEATIKNNRDILKSDDANFDFDNFKVDEIQTDKLSVTISGDSSTLIKLCYKRNEYTIRFVYARNYNKYVTNLGGINVTQMQLSNNTGSGYETSKSIEQYTSEAGITWDYIVSNGNAPNVTLPEDLPDNVSVDKGTYENKITGKDKYLGIVSTTTIETLYYIDLTAEYGADIEKAWPTNFLANASGYNKDATNKILTFSFNSWTSESGSEFRPEGTVGSYPTMSSELIYHTDGDIAQTFCALWNSSEVESSNIHQVKIYYEALNPSDIDSDATTETIDGITYVLDDDKTITFQCTDDTKINPLEYSGFTLVNADVTGKSCNDTTYSQESNETDEKGNTIWTTNLYYSRNTFTLKFFNYNYKIKEYDDVKYGASLSKPENEPDYPTGLEKGKYEFAGWYTDDTYLESSKVDWENITMPDSDLVLYAYWKPKTYTIKFYLDELSVEDEPLKTVDVEYGKLIQAEDIPDLGTTYTIDGKSYEAKQVGWFYYDSTGTKHAFDWKNTPVSDDMKLFMAWETNVPTYFEIRYITKDTEGNIFDVAPTFQGYSFVGIVATFTPKTGTDLDEAYQTGYFPSTASITMLMKAEESQDNIENNIVTFEYFKKKEEISYTVKYLDIDTNESVMDAVEKTSDTAVVTEDYVPVSGYIPTSYHQTLTLTLNADGESDTEHNVITFYYKQNTDIMLCHVRYLREDANGDGTYQTDDSAYIDSNENVNQNKDINLVNYTGYTATSYTITNYDVEGKQIGDPVEGTISSNDITANKITIKLEDKESGVYSKNIRIYYTRNTYLVTVSYKLQPTDGIELTFAEVETWYKALKSSTELKDVTLTPNGNTYENTTYYTEYCQTIEDNTYRTTYTSTAPELTGFTFADSKTKSIMVQDSNDANANSIQFTYNPVKKVQISYVVKFVDTPIGQDAPTSYPISISKEEVAVGDRPTSVTAQLTHKNYKFLGWYTDEDCNTPVVDATVENEPNILTGESSSVLTPPTVTDSPKYTTYYAKYQYQCGELTITNTNASDDNQTFEYVVTGTDTYNQGIEITVCIVGNGNKTITGLPVGKYTVTQTGWSWRYTGSSENSKVEVSADEVATVTFSQTMENTKWLDGNSHQDMTVTKTES
jgi:uncharacterized repeat protein (TIGR02543 family)